MPMSALYDGAVYKATIKQVVFQPEYENKSPVENMKNGRIELTGHFIFDLLPGIRFKVISSPSAVALTNLQGNP